MMMRAGLGWSHAGGTIVYRDKPVGFLIDVRPFDKWKATDPKTITVPLTSTTLIDRQHTRMLKAKGLFLVALVKAATIDDPARAHQQHRFHQDE